MSFHRVPSALWTAATCQKRCFAAPALAKIPESSQIGDSSQVTEDEVDLLPSRFARLSPAARHGSSKIGSVVLPDELIHAVEQHIQDVDKMRLRQDALDLYKSLRLSSAELRKRKSSTNDPRPVDPLPPYNTNVVSAYAAALMPGVYAATYHVLKEVSKRAGMFDGWRPTQLYDYGCGTASAAWAAVKVWPELKHYTGFDQSRPMIMLASSILKPLDVPHTLKQTDLNVTSLEAGNHTSVPNRSSLALSAFTLSEIRHPSKRKAFIRNLCSTPSEVIVLIERGTPAGFALIAEARQQILDLDAEIPVHVIAPCPHDKRCPLRFKPDFCHFSQRRELPASSSVAYLLLSYSGTVEQPDFLRKTKHSHAGELDSSFSYVAFRKGTRPQENERNLGSLVSKDGPLSVNAEALPKITLHHKAATVQEDAYYAMPKPSAEMAVTPDGDAAMYAMKQESLSWPRLLAPPMKRSGHIVMDACSVSGEVERFIIPKSQGRQAYHDARKAHWGDAFPHAPKKASRIRDRGIRKLRALKPPRNLGEAKLHDVQNQTMPAELADFGRNLAALNAFALANGTKSTSTEEEERG